MKLSMKDGRVIMSIGLTSVPLNMLPMEQWKEGKDVTNHPALQRWNEDCNRRFVKEGE
jgi:hypothetical protein